MYTIAIEAVTPLFRTSHINLYENIARSRLFCRIAKRSIGGFVVRGSSGVCIGVLPHAARMLSPGLLAEFWASVVEGLFCFCPVRYIHMYRVS